MTPKTPDVAPRAVYLFSGHMVDAPHRASPRFPASKEAVAKAAIERLLDQLGAGRADLGICGGACGADLLFAEAVLDRGTALELYLPLDEPRFLARSVDFAGADWRRRYFLAKARSVLHLMPEERGPLLAGQDPFEQNNIWMLESASRFGAERVDFICLWNGQGGDGPGGIQHMLHEVRRHSGRTHWLDTTRLWS